MDHLITGSCLSLQIRTADTCTRAQVSYGSDMQASCLEVSESCCTDLQGLPKA